ncbi:MAG: V-type ATP synthase subunit E [Chlamydiota bacterium]|nr:V-type ATP synthase subunit E [Chlamydiota bacterium]
MGIHGLLKHLEDEANEHKENLLKETREKINAILSEAQRNADILIQSKLALTKEKLEIEEARKISEARLQSNRLVLESKQNVLDGIFHQVQIKLAELKQTSEYPSILENLIREVCQSLQDNTTIQVSTDDLSLAKTIIAKQKLKAVLQSNDSIHSGLIATSSDGKLKIINTLETRLLRAIDGLDTEIVRILWNT